MIASLASPMHAALRSKVSPCLFRVFTSNPLSKRRSNVSYISRHDGLHYLRITRSSEMAT